MKNGFKNKVLFKGFIGGLIVCLRETDILKKRLRNEVKKDE